MRRCADCGSDITDRNPRARHCLSCVAAHRVMRGKHRFAWITSDPERHERYKSYQREWDRRKSAKRPCRIGTCLCGTTFVLNPLGAPRRYCRPCAAFYAQDLKNANQRKHYRRVA